MPSTKSKPADEYKEGEYQSSLAFVRALVCQVLEPLAVQSIPKETLAKALTEVAREFEEIASLPLAEFKGHCLYYRS